MLQVVQTTVVRFPKRRKQRKREGTVGLMFDKPSRSARKKNKADKNKLDRETIKLFSLVVQDRAGNKCEYPGCTRPSSEAHHVYSKEIKVVRYAEDDGIASCPYHHTMDPKTAAHRDPLYMTTILNAGVRTHEWFEKLTVKTRQTVKFDLDFIHFHHARLKQIAIERGIDVSFCVW